MSTRQLNVKVSTELHVALIAYCNNNRITLTKAVTEALKSWLTSENPDRSSESAAPVGESAPAAGMPQIATESLDEMREDPDLLEHSPGSFVNKAWAENVGMVPTKAVSAAIATPLDKEVTPTHGAHESTQDLSSPAPTSRK